MPGRVAIIGAGPSGLSQLHAFEQARAAGVEVPELVCFERQDDWGGLWNYSWRSGVDRHGDPCHGSMYRNLWSNGPKECLEFADYTFEEHFGRPIPSFPPRAVLEDYIAGRARRSGVRRHIRFGTAVRWVEHDVGHRQGHARRRRQLLRRGHRAAGAEVRRPLGDDQLPDCGDGLPVAGRDHRGPCLERVDGRTVTFSDGSARDVDAIVLCTGYRHHFPFVASDLRLATSNVLYPPDLYKGMFWVDNPNLMYLSMQDQFYTFTMFDAEAWYARDYVLGRITLPGRDEMRKDIASWRAREDALADASEQIDFQADHVADLLSEVDYPAFDLDLTREHFKTWEHHKTESIIGYRDQGFSSPCTGTPAPVHHTRWWAALDDSMPAFLDQDTTAAG